MDSSVKERQESGQIIRKKEKSNLRQVIFKIAQRCNINCTYCYVYNMGDDSWAAREKFASAQIVSTLAKRLKEHIDNNELENVHLELHGGEPLLYGVARTRKLLETMISIVGESRVRFSIQTNGLLLNEEWVDLFHEFSVQVGISIDGPPSLKSSRVDGAGVDTTPKLLMVLERLRITRPGFRPGALSVLSDDSDVCGLIEWFPTIGINSFDLLFPLGNRVTPPVGVTNLNLLLENLIKGFEQWRMLGRHGPRIRLYELMLEGFLGHSIILDALGGDLTALCVVETNGAIGMNDVTRFLGGKYSSDDINILTHTLDAHSQHFNIPASQRLCEKCQRCEVANACGGGYLPDRFDGVSFQNPTYYCEVMLGLGQHMIKYLESSIPKSAWTTGLNRNG
ncbi:radical SAM protein [Stutzerimonas kunmingensis]|uniref:radical SAM protein n=1 Tax=Stutzerimonas kunmingensis TaxID=1211807 RepID=UPI00289F1E6B|nr:radical SAM protein [Stutzerimonas kunmingensis]